MNFVHTYLLYSSVFLSRDEDSSKNSFNSITSPSRISSIEASMQRLSSRPSLSRPSSLIRAGRLWCMRLPPLFSRWRATVASHQRDFFKMVKHLIELIESMYTYYNSLLLCTYIFNLQNSILSNVSLYTLDISAIILPSRDSPDKVYPLRPLLPSQIFLPSWEKSRQISSVDKSSPKNQSTGEDYLDRELRNEGTRKHFYPHPLTGKQNPKASLNNDQPNQSSRQPSRRDPETRQKQPMYPLSNHPRVPSPSLYTLDRFPLPLDDRFESRFTAATATRASPSLVFQITKKASKIAFVHRAWVDVTGLQKRGGQKNAGMRFYRLFPALVASEINSLLPFFFRSKGLRSPLFNKLVISGSVRGTDRAMMNRP